MNNIEQQIKLQTLIASHSDKLESFITAIESVLNPIVGIPDTEVVVEEEKPYKWDSRDLYSLCYKDVCEGYLEAEVIMDVTPRGRIETHFSVYNCVEDNIKPYTEDIRLHFKPWKANGKRPKDLARYYAVIYEDGEIDVIDGDLPVSLLVFAKAVGYCNLLFVNKVFNETEQND